MKICVIGGAGFVGTRLIDVLKNEFSISIIDKNPSPFYNDITCICDIENLDELKEKTKGFDLIIHLAAEHKDNVLPIARYYDVNVKGTQNILDAMDFNGIKNIIFTSSVAVYGLNKNNPTEDHEIDAFNHYGKSKYKAEEVLRDWFNKDRGTKSLVIIRPTVIFGERNRGNVYNLLRQIAIGQFLRIGNGLNLKSMAYVGNVVAFMKFIIQKNVRGYFLYNYVDKPDLNMNQLVLLVQQTMKKNVPPIRIPYWLGITGGTILDIISTILRKDFAISAVRVKKFCATTQYDATKAHSSGFNPPYNLEEGLIKTLKYEFIEEPNDTITFESE